MSKTTKEVTIYSCDIVGCKRNSDFELPTCFVCGKHVCYDHRYDYTNKLKTMHGRDIVKCYFKACESCYHLVEEFPSEKLLEAIKNAFGTTEQEN